MAARIVKERTERRNEILTVARQLVITKGYEQMTIQDILDSLQISKGAFYHYFDSKQALLEALIENIVEETKRSFTPILEDGQLSALEKFGLFFRGLGQWKTAQIEFLLALLNIWYNDDNAIVRQKITTASIEHITPLITQIIIQGVQEGCFNTAYPQQASVILLTIGLGLSNMLAMLLLTAETRSAKLPEAEQIVAASTEATERVLGAPQGSLQLVDDAVLTQWFT